MTNVGLIIVVVAWIFQVKATSKKSAKIDPKFLVGYMIGMLLLIWDGIKNGSMNLAILNLFCFLGAAITNWKLKK